MPIMRWQADDELAELIRRYYAGEAGLWEAIRAQVDAALRAQNVRFGAYHMRLLRRAGGGYDVLVEDASGYEREP